MTAPAARRPLGARIASLWLPALFAGGALATLLSLGFWQLERLSWKEALIGQIAARAHGPAGEIVPEAAWPGWRAADDEFRRVQVRGTFLSDLTVPVIGLAEQRPGQAVQGVYLFTPLRRPDGSIVVVNRGFVPTEKRNETGTAAPAGDVQITGLVRAPEDRTLFVPENDPARDRWFVRSLGDMVRAKGLTRVAPFYIDADAGAEPSGWPRGGQTPLKLRNNHLGYALTWFGLALTLVGVFGAFVWRRLQDADAASAGELEPQDAGHDQADAGEPPSCGGITEQHHAADRRPDRADAGPDRIGGPER
ncbi:MAG: surfeit 1 [Enterovirga sp.]|nr:surfeit 1 [Enterovirga sp.]